MNNFFPSVQTFIIIAPHEFSLNLDYKLFKKISFLQNAQNENIQERKNVNLQNSEMKKS